MSERRKLAEEIYLALHGNGYFAIVWKDEYEEHKQKIIDVIEADIPDVDAIRDAGRDDERLKLHVLTRERLCRTCFDRICTDCQERLTGNCCAKCGTVPEFSTKDPNFCRDCGAKFERPKKDPYLIGLRNSEVQDLIDEKFSIHVRHFREGDMEAVLNHVVHEFNWQRVYDQIENIADKFIADLYAQRG